MPGAPRANSVNVSAPLSRLRNTMGVQRSARTCEEHWPQRQSGLARTVALPTTRWMRVDHDHPNASESIEAAGGDFDTIPPERHVLAALRPPWSS